MTFSTGMSFDLNQSASLEAVFNLGSLSNKNLKMDSPFEIRFSFGD